MISDDQLHLIVKGFGIASVGLILVYHFISSNNKDIEEVEKKDA